MTQRPVRGQYWDHWLHRGQVEVSTVTCLCIIHGLYRSLCHPWSVPASTRLLYHPWSQYWSTRPLYHSWSQYWSLQAAVSLMVSVLVSTGLCVTHGHRTDLYQASVSPMVTVPVSTRPLYHSWSQYWSLQASVSRMVTVQTSTRLLYHPCSQYCPPPGLCITHGHSTGHYLSVEVSLKNLVASHCQ